MLHNKRNLRSPKWGLFYFVFIILYCYFFYKGIESNFIATNFYNDLIWWAVCPVGLIISNILLFIHRDNLFKSMELAEPYERGFQRIIQWVKKVLTILFIQVMTVAYIAWPFDGMAWFFTDKFANSTYNEQVWVRKISLSSTRYQSKKTEIIFLTNDQREHTIYISSSLYYGYPGIEKLENHTITLIGRKGLFGAVVDDDFTYPSTVDITNR